MHQSMKLFPLLGFNEKVESSKEEARIALQRIPGIINKIDQANETSIGAQGTIDAAEEDALKAREVAGMAEANATAASEVNKTNRGQVWVWING